MSTFINRMRYLQPKQFNQLLHSCGYRAEPHVVEVQFVRYVNDTETYHYQVRLEDDHQWLPAYVYFDFDKMKMNVLM